MAVMADGCGGIIMNVPRGSRVADPKYGMPVDTTLGFPNAHTELSRAAIKIISDRVVIADTDKISPLELFNARRCLTSGADDVDMAHTYTSPMSVSAADPKYAVVAEA